MYKVGTREELADLGTFLSRSDLLSISSNTSYNATHTRPRSHRRANSLYRSERRMGSVESGCEER